MLERELTIQELLWLSSVAKGKCPYCESALEITPKDMFFKMGWTEKDKNGNKKEHLATWGVRCPHCEKDLKIKPIIELTKMEEEE